MVSPLAMLVLVACGARIEDSAGVVGETAVPPTPSHYVLDGATVVGLGRQAVEVRDGLIVAVGDDAAADVVIQRPDTWLVPAFIDSHVHFAYDDRVAAMLRGGVAGSVDWAAPLSFLEQDQAPMRIVSSGPMITAVGGYPTTSWGAGGYGLECASVEEAVAAVNTVLSAGAGVVKIPMTGSAELQAEAVAAVVERAHLQGVKVGLHALGSEAARRGEAADVLVHMPTELLAEEPLDDFEAVIPTLAAFGNRPEARQNLRRLKEAGTLVLYGTDFGNARATGVSAAEIAAMQEAGLSAKEILDSGTLHPAAYFGFSELGALEPGKAASFMVLERDPLDDVGVLAEPSEVYIDGVRLR